MRFLGSCPRAPCNPAYEQDVSGSNRLASCYVAVSKPEESVFISCPSAGETYMYTNPYRFIFRVGLTNGRVTL